MERNDAPQPSQAHHPSPAAAAAAAPPPPDDGAYHAEVQAGIALFHRLAAQLDAGGPEPDWEPLRGRLGFCLEPTPWARLAALIAEGSPRSLGSLGRTPMQLHRYYSERDGAILRQFASVTDYLRQRVFGLDTVPGPDGRLVVLAPPGFFSSSGDGQVTAVWRDNDYPYHLEPGVSHINLWATRPLTAAEVQGHIARQVPPGAETLWFVNPPVLQSVPGIWHAHIFIRPQSQQQQQQAEQWQQQQQQQQQQQRQGEAATGRAAGPC